MMKAVYLASHLADKGVCTGGIQQLIDECAAAGGGQVRFTAGTYLTATLELRSNVELYLDAGAVIRGVDDCRLYRNRYWEITGRSQEGFFTSPMWYDALICAYEQHDIAIRGHGMIDGADCCNEAGEQHFRGPHGVYFFRCTNVHMEGVTIVRAGNYATMYEECEHARIEKLRIFGGQDAMRVFRCNDFDVRCCDFRTGDDCVSGPMNTNMRFYDCMFNTPGGNTFLMGCINLHVKHCKLWSQGEYPATFKENKRYSNSWTGFAMLHDSDDGNKMLSDNWLLEDIELENIETVFRHDRKMYFQDGRAGRVVIDGIRAVNFIYPITLDGKEGDTLDFTLRNGVFVRRRDDSGEDRAFLRADWFKRLTIENVTVENCGDELISARHGGKVRLQSVKTIQSVEEKQLCAESVEGVEMLHDAPRTSADLYVFDQVDSIYVPINQDETFRGARRWICP